MKCILCNQRKAKRFCPAKNTVICAQCCGEKRVLEIDCPEGCEFLKLGRQREFNAEMARYYRPTDPTMMRKYQRVFTEFQPFVGQVQAFLANERSVLRDLTDADVAAVLDLVLDGLRTEDKGVLYDRPSSDLRLDAMRRQLGNLIEAHRKPAGAEPAQPYLITARTPDALRLGDAIECLEVLRNVVESHIQAEKDSQAYVNFLVRVMPRDQKAGTGSPLIIPGR